MGILIIMMFKWCYLTHMREENSTYKLLVVSTLVKILIGSMSKVQFIFRPMASLFSVIEKCTPTLVSHIRNKIIVSLQDQGKSMCTDQQKSISMTRKTTLGACPSPKWINDFLPDLFLEWNAKMLKKWQLSSQGTMSGKWDFTLIFLFLKHVR